MRAKSFSLNGANAYSRMQHFGEVRRVKLFCKIIIRGGDEESNSTCRVRKTSLNPKINKD